MIASLLARFHQPADYDLDRYAAWTSALQTLRDDWAKGARPRPDELLPRLGELTGSQRAEALRDLVAEHLRLSWRDGCGSPLESYPLDEVSPELAEDELLARFQPAHGDMPDLAEYRSRFGTAVLAVLAPRFLDNGRYVKLRKIGLGALGEVWEAHDTRLRRRVAIKQLRREFIAHPASLQLFAAEAAVTAALDHPGIVGVHDFYEGATPYCVMRLVEGQTFAERIADFHHPPMDRTPADRRALWQRILRSFASICDAVAFAHSRGVLHRDLKPANVVVGSFGETAVLDWGNDSVAGTPDYMAPEQADGSTDERTDVFGLGAILYEVLTGRSPHGWPEGSRPHDWREHVRAARFAQPRKIDQSAPRALEAICIRALQRDPAARYQTAAEVAEEVRRYLACEPVIAWREPFHLRLLRSLVRKS